METERTGTISLGGFACLGSRRKPQVMAQRFAGTMEIERTETCTLSDIVCVGSHRKSQAGAQRFAGVLQ